VERIVRSSSSAARSESVSPGATVTWNRCTYCSGCWTPRWEQCRALLRSRGSTGPSLPGGRRGRCPNAYRGLVIEPYARSRTQPRPGEQRSVQPRHRERLPGARRRLPPVHADRGVRADRRDRRLGALPRQDLREVRLLCRAHAVDEIVIADPRRRRRVLAMVRQGVHPGLGKSAAGGNWGGSGGRHPMAVRGSARSCLSDPLNAAGAKSMLIGSRHGHRAADRTSMQGGLGKRQRARPLEAGVSVHWTR